MSDNCQSATSTAYSISQFDDRKYFCLDTKGAGDFFNFAKLRYYDGIVGMCENGNTPCSGESLLQQCKTFSCDQARSV